ncbi:four helix bundle protein [uncultured Caulobacter sp.]|uniref:four helix bundle protein n=1 Tax=uncultured Caulobacter sp. TaxID=158749 RepID=UPI00260A3F54|nr:four helix bundle protein [uncultured Caulobacter sp.]
MGVNSESVLDNRLLRLIKQLNKYLNHFPRHERYGLSLQIRTAAYDVYGLVVEAQKRHHKKTSLSNLDVRHEQLRMFVRLAHELGYFEFKDGTQIGASPATIADRRYHAIAKMVDEVGCLIGGWISAERVKERDPDRK